jgi:hypothetical protein
VGPEKTRREKIDSQAKMPNHKRRAKGKNRAKSSSTQGPPSSATVYRGPIVPRAMKDETFMILVRVTYSSTATSSPSGVLNVSVTNNPSGGLDWSSLVATWAEFRVLAQRLIWVPVLHNYSLSTTTAVPSPMVMYSTRDPSNIPNTESLAFGYEDATVGHTDTKMTKSLRMSGTPDSSWVETATPAASWAIGLVAEGLTLSTIYGSVFNEWLVQFRLHR